MSNEKRSRKKKQKNEMHAAFYLDELDDIALSSSDEFAERATINKRVEQQKKPQRQKKKRKPRKKNRILRRIITYALLFLFLLQVPMIYGILRSFRLQQFGTYSTIEQTKGILLLGVDNDGGGLENGFTDSITYLAVNFKTKQAVALPIYRDVNINQTCTGNTDNINRIYGQNGIACLIESTSAFLQLPIDYYIVITMEGLIKIVDALDGVDITPTDSFCSDYGEDGVNYCFKVGIEEKMSGAQALAYIRYRGSSNGEKRANRQLELILAIKNECMESMLFCYTKATPILPDGVRTNIPLTALLSFSGIFSSDFNFETLPVIDGYNTTNEKGWTQYVNTDDLEEKTSVIRSRIFMKSNSAITQ